MDYIARPTWNRSIKGRRAEVRFRRHLAAWNMASIVSGDRVPQEEYDAAFSLLNRIIRYSLADIAEWERENSSESYCNSAYHKEEERKLDARRKKLQNELHRYGLRMVNYGLYPTIVNKNNTDMNLLHYFD